MDSQNNYEQEIDLKDLMFAVLRRWRPILLIAVVFALLLGGFKAFKGMGQLKDAEYMASKTQEYEDSQDEYEISKERLEKEVENLKSSIESQNEYMENSVLMNINPYDEYVSTASIYVSTDYQIMPGMAYQNPNTTSSIMTAYMSIAQNGEMYNYVLKNLDLDLERRYLQELVKVEPDFSNSLFNITVTYNTQDGANAIMSLIQDSMNKSKDTITQAIGPHEINVIDESEFATVDLELEKKQQEQTAKIAELNLSLTTKTKELNELEEPTEALPSRSGAIKSAVKYTLLGGVLGGFLTVFCICVAFLMSDKLVNEKELRRRYGLMILGVFTGAEKKGLFAFIDRWIDRMEGKDSHGLSNDQVYHIIAANVENYAGGGKNVLLVSSDTGAAALGDIGDSLARELTSLTLTQGGNLDRDAGAIKKAAACEAVILVEKRGSSTFSGIERELDIVRSLEKPVLGCVIL